MKKYTLFLAILAVVFSSFLDFNIAVASATSGDNNIIVPNGTASMSLDAATPVARHIYAGAVNVEMARVKISANDIEDLKLYQLTVGVTGSASDISLIYLYDGATKLGVALPVSSTGVAKFFPNVIIPKNSSKVISIRADISPSANAGYTIALGVTQDSVVFGVSSQTTSPIEGGPVNGNTMTVSNFSEKIFTDYLSNKGYSQSDVNAALLVYRKYVTNPNDPTVASWFNSLTAEQKQDVANAVATSSLNSAEKTFTDYLLGKGYSQNDVISALLMYRKYVINPNDPIVASWFNSLTAQQKQDLLEALSRI